MKLPSEAVLLRVFIGENDRHEGRSTYQAVVEQARRSGLAGATVLKGALGFGAHSRIHTAKILRLSQDLPIVVEIVDTQDKIDAFLPVLEELIDEGMVTLEPVRVLVYRAGPSDG